MSNLSYSEIRALFPTVTLTNGDLIVIENNGNTRTITLDELNTFLTGNTVLQNVASSYRHAVLTSSGNLPLLEGILSWDVVEADTNSFYSGAAPTRLRIEAGITKVKVSTNIIIHPDSDSLLDEVNILKNGNTTPVASMNFNAGDGGSVYLATKVIPVNANDYFEIDVKSSGLPYGTSDSWFQIEVLEMSA